MTISHITDAALTHGLENVIAGSAFPAEEEPNSAPNNRVRTRITAAKSRLIALCNSPAPPAALERQEPVRRVVVCKSVARTHAVVPTRLDLHNRRADL